MVSSPDCIGSTMHFTFCFENGLKVRFEEEYELNILGYMRNHLVETLAVCLDDANMMRCYCLEGVIMELRFSMYFFISSLISFVRWFPHHTLYWFGRFALFIKWSKSPFQGGIQAEYSHFF
jgi:hypothetical protein